MQIFVKRQVLEEAFDWIVSNGVILFKDTVTHMKRPNIQKSTRESHWFHEIAQTSTIKQTHHSNLHFFLSLTEVSRAQDRSRSATSRNLQHKGIILYRLGSRVRLSERAGSDTNEWTLCDRTSSNSDKCISTAESSTKECRESVSLPSGRPYLTRNDTTGAALNIRLKWNWNTSRCIHKLHRIWSTKIIFSD